MDTLNNFDYRELVSLRREDVEVVAVQRLARATKLFRYQPRLRKLLFFFFREGVVAVFRKIRSRRFQQNVERQEVFLICRLKGSSVYFGGYQFSQDQPYYYFLRSAQINRPPSLKDYTRLVSLNPFVGYVPEDLLRLPVPAPAALQHFNPVVLERSDIPRRSDCDLYVVGFGDYARTQILPLFRNLHQFVAVDHNPLILRSRYLRGFQYCTNDFDTSLNFKSPASMRMGIIASYHSFHASQALAFLQLPESSVLIEKPPCLTIAELEALAAQYDPHRIFLGYNRRFIEWNWRARDILDAHGLPVVMTIMVNEAQIASDHWYFASNQGSRVSGNLCHFLDLAVFLLQKQPVRISLGRNTVLGIERSTFVVLFEDGSIVNLIPSDLGDGTRGVQEHISIKSESLELTIGDYLWMRVWEKGRVRKYAVLHRNKGHQAMYRNYKQSVFQGRPSTIGRRELIHSSLLYISFVRLFASGDDAKELDFSPFGLYMS